MSFETFPLDDEIDAVSQDQTDERLADQHSFTERLGDIALQYSSWAERRPYAATALETVAVFAGRYTVREAGARAGLNLGNALTTNDKAVEEALKRPILYGGIQILAAPIVEELGSRVVPGKIADAQQAKGRTRLATGIRHGVDIAFAAWHAGVIVPEIKENSLKPSFHLRNEGENLSLPVSQYIAGRNLRRIYEKRGYGPAVFSHIVNNAINAGVGYLKYRKSKK
jgi:hypothetical protein